MASLSTTTSVPAGTQVTPVAAPSVGSTLVNAIEGNIRASTAGDQAASGFTNAINAVNNIYGQNTALTAPYLIAGAGAGNAMAANAQPYIGAGQNAIGNLQQLQQQPLNTQSFLDPSMAFAMQQGQQALERSAAARGGALSGAALQDLTKYATGLASENYNNAAQLALNDRAQRIGVGQQLYTGGLTANSQLGNIYQGGLTALGNQVTSGSNYGNIISTLLQGQGQSAANYTGQQQNLWAPVINAAGDAYNAYTKAQGGNTTGSTGNLGVFDSSDPENYWTTVFKG